MFVLDLKKKSHPNETGNYVCIRATMYKTGEWRLYESYQKKKIRKEKVIYLKKK